MVRRVALQMDPIGSLDLTREATFLLGLEAQERGCELWHYTPDKLSWRDGRIIAAAEPLALTPSHTFTLGRRVALDLRRVDVVLLRQNPPFDMAYISSTYLLGQLHPKTLVVNNPAAVRDLPEKIFPTRFAAFMPPTLISSDIEQIRDFHREQKDIVLKPLYGYGGHLIYRLRPRDANFSKVTKTLFRHSKEPWVAQRFLPEMRTGERRLIMIDGKLACFAARIPARGAATADMHAGAHYEKAKPTRRHLDIAAAVGPVLKKYGLLFAGIDVIGDYLTEINITSPGSLSYLNALYGVRLEKQIWDAIEKKL